MKLTRRRAFKTVGAGALTPFAAGLLPAAQVLAAPKKSRNTPRIALGMGDGGAGPDRAASAKRIKQLGVNQVLSGGPLAPWTEDRRRVARRPKK